MYAVIETGGKQYRVSKGDTIRVETLPGEEGSSVEFSKVLAIKTDDGILVGEKLASAKVTGKIVGEGRGPKIIVFKFKRKKQYKRTQGHRQDFTSVEVEDILA
ncbi:MAG: 50S ribosomal protein L21 [Bryobacterales bacterium]|nr:50S ribosomal protein L21 [Bryobacterales bacterium]